MTSRGDLRKLLRRLEKDGMDVVRSRRRGHWKIYDHGRLTAVAASTPSDHRSRANLAKDIKRKELQ